MSDHISKNKSLMEALRQAEESIIKSNGRIKASTMAVMMNKDFNDDFPLFVELNSEQLKENYKALETIRQLKP